MNTDIAKTYNEAELLKVNVVNLEDRIKSAALMAAPAEGWPGKNEEQRAIAREQSLSSDCASIAFCSPRPSARSRPSRPSAANANGQRACATSSTLSRRPARRSSPAKICSGEAASDRQWADLITVIRSAH